MAVQVTTTHIDDIDPNITEDVQTVMFSLNGTDYALDLGEMHRDWLDASLKPFIEAATVVTPIVKTRTPSKTGAPKDSRTREMNRRVREWAVANGMEISERGRIPANVVQAYEAAVIAEAEANVASDKPARRRKATAK